MSYFTKHFDFGTNLRKALEIRGLTQVELSNKMKIHKTHVNKWVQNKVKPSASYLDQMSEILNFPVESLLTGDFFGSKNKKDEKIKTVNSEIESIRKLLNFLAESDGDEDEIIEIIIKRFRALL